MKDWNNTRHSKVLLFLVSILILSSCNKLNMPSWLTLKKNEASETTRFDWPRWRGPDQNGVSKETEWNPKALANGPKVVWKVNVGRGFSNVAIKGEFLYTMGYDSKENQDVVYCLSVKNGENVWRYSYSGELGRYGYGTLTTPTIDGDYIYTLRVQGDLLCLDAKRGKVQWRKNIVEEYQVQAPHYGFAGSPVVDGDLIVLTANIAGLALSKKTGERVWGSEKPPKKYYPGNSTGTEYATPVVYEQRGKRYAIVPSQRGLFSVDVETGKPLWLFDWEKAYDIDIQAQVAEPIIFNNKLFIVQYYNRHIGSVLLDIEGKSPKVLWTNKNMKSETSSPVMVDGHFYVCQGGVESSTGSLRCFDVKTGDMLWEETLSGRPVSLTAANGKLIVLDAKGTLYIAEATPSAYREISRGIIPNQKGFESWWTPPVLCRGRIYCRSSIGDLVCIDVSK